MLIYEYAASEEFTKAQRAHATNILNIGFQVLFSKYPLFDQGSSKEFLYFNIVCCFFGCDNERHNIINWIVGVGNSFVRHLFSYFKELLSWS